MISKTIASVTESELTFIASLDYGVRADEHFAALKRVIYEQGGLPRADQYWFPYEVIELGAHHLEPSHEREFAICTFLVIAAVNAGVDCSTDLSQKFHDRAADYDRLPLM